MKLKDAVEKILLGDQAVRLPDHFDTTTSSDMVQAIVGFQEKLSARYKNIPEDIERLDRQYHNPKPTVKITFPNGVEGLDMGSNPEQDKFDIQLMWDDIRRDMAARLRDLQRLIRVHEQVKIDAQSNPDRKTKREQGLAAIMQAFDTTIEKAIPMRAKAIELSRKPAENVLGREKDIAPRARATDK